MKAEERKQLERNELAVRLNSAWQGLTSNSTTVTVIWAVILIGLVALIGYRYYARSSSETRSGWLIATVFGITSANTTTITAMIAVA